MSKIAPLLLILFVAAVPLSGAPRPNIILCMADDMGWGDPSYNSTTVTFANGSPHPDQGWIQTPNLDAMAANGLRFDRFYSASAVCSPTRASCLTGRNPFRVGVPTANAGRLGFDETPLSTLLSAQGYRCGHFGKWHLGSMTTLRPDSNRGGNAAVYSAPWHHHYDTCFATESKLPTYHPYRKANNSLALPTSFADPNFYGTYYWRLPATWNTSSGEGAIVPIVEVNNAANGDDSKLLVDQVLPFLQDSVAQDEPFFVVLWFHTPHKPVVDPAGLSGVDSSAALKASIEDMDTAVGRVRDELTTLGVRGNTMFWFTSDNGPEDGDNSPNETSTVRSIRSGRLLERKRSLHEGGVRVPGILEWPDVIATGRATNFPAITSDYYPTILDLLELSVADQKPLDGISLRPVIENTAATRAKPIGFLFGSDRAWTSHRYKLIDDGSGWELYDLLDIAPGQEVEQSPLATAANISSQPVAIRDLYDTILAEFNAWSATVGSDSPYIHASQPTCVLGGPSEPVAGEFTVTVTFSENVTHLNAGEFAIGNGNATELSGGGSAWTLTVTPSSLGPVTVDLPEGSAIDSDGNPNAAPARLTISNGSLPATIDPIVTSLPLVARQTVDRSGRVPGDGSNNLAKFTAGNINDRVANPFTTTLYARSSTGGEAEARTVRAFARFDLSSLHGLPVSKATLRFRGHSLNDDSGNTTDIEVIAAGANWSDVGLPAPTFNHATFGVSANGDSVTIGLNSTDHTRDYSFDVATAVRNWGSAVWPNYGLQIRLTNQSVNNGVGIKTSGTGEVELIVEEQPLKIVDLFAGPAASDVTLTWSSVPGLDYQIESSPDLAGPWNPVAIVTGADGATTQFTHEDGMTGFDHRFYRVSFPLE